MAWRGHTGAHRQGWLLLYWWQCCTYICTRGVERKYRLPNSIPEYTYKRWHYGNAWYAIPYVCTPNDYIPMYTFIDILYEHTVGASRSMSRSCWPCCSPSTMVSKLGSSWSFRLVACVIPVTLVAIGFAQPNSSSKNHSKAVQNRRLTLTGYVSTACWIICA